MSGTRHSLAWYYFNKIKELMSTETLTSWEMEFLTSIVENEKLTETECKLSKKEYDSLARIANNVVIKKYARKK